MRGRVRGYLRLSRKAAVVEQRPYGAAVALVGVHTDHLDGIRPPPRLLLHPSAQVSGVAPVEYVDDLAGGGVDRGGDEPPPAEAAGRRHGCLVEPQLCDRAHPGGIAGELLGGFRTADHSVCQPTPSRRAEDATDPSTASSLPTAHPTAREVNTRRGPASPDVSVQDPVSHPRLGHDHTRFFHRTRTGRPPAAGASRKHTSRRPLDRALRPQRSQNTLWPSGVCTHTTTSPRSSRTPVTSKPSAPNHTTELT